MDLTHLLVRVPRDSEETPEAMQNLLASMVGVGGGNSGFNPFAKKSAGLALEIAVYGQYIRFLLSFDTANLAFVESQITSNYPKALTENTHDPLEHLSESWDLRYGESTVSYYFPISNYASFREADPMSSILSVLSQVPEDQTLVYQIALEPISNKWQKGVNKMLERIKDPENTASADEGEVASMKEKLMHPGFTASVRLLSSSTHLMAELVNSFSVFNNPAGNSLKFKKVGFPHKASFIAAVKARRASVNPLFRPTTILNTAELATIWHLPSEKIKVPSIVWGHSVLSEPPENLPIAAEQTGETKQEINFFAKTQFKNSEHIFGIKSKDRLRHIWTMGKTGTGKSTMISNMAIDDIKKGRGLCVIDPHGDLCDDLLDYIPASRINETIYLNPADSDFPIVLNPLEVRNKEEAELVVAGLMSIFTKVWANVWSARMEYILRNSFMTLTEIPDSTMFDVLKLISDKKYRDKVLTKVTDKPLLHFWQDEFDQMPETLQREAIAPIQNKVGQFVTSPMIRRIISKPKSSISIEDIMDEGKILLVNLSQGRLGEDNSALLGAMLITKIQLAAMSRVDTPKDERRPFYLYVDEFQNFATDSFVKILSEARKYGLAITLANQYMAQIPEKVQKAIMGNAGTIISFAVGAEDANVIHKEFAEVFSQNDLVNLQNYQVAVKLMVDAHSTRPFLAYTLPLPKSSNKNRAKVIKVSRERWAKK